MAEVQIQPCVCGATPTRNWQARCGRGVWRVECQCGIAGPWQPRAEDASTEWNALTAGYRMRDKLLNALKPLAAFADTDMIEVKANGVAFTRAQVDVAAALIKEARGEK